MVLLAGGRIPAVCLLSVAGSLPSPHGMGGSWGAASVLTAMAPGLGVG